MCVCVAGVPALIAVCVCVCVAGVPALIAVCVCVCVAGVPAPSRRDEELGGRGRHLPGQGRPQPQVRPAAASQRGKCDSLLHHDVVSVTHCCITTW